MRIYSRSLLLRCSNFGLVLGTTGKEIYQKMYCMTGIGEGKKTLLKVGAEIDRGPGKQVYLQMARAAPESKITGAVT